MKKIKLNEEVIKKFKKALDVFIVNQKKGNAMLDRIYEEQQHDDTEKFYCQWRGCEVTFRKDCKNCIWGSRDEDGNFYCPYYKK